LVHILFLFVNPLPDSQDGKAKRKRAKALGTQKASSATKNPPTTPDKPPTERDNKSHQGDNVSPLETGPLASDSGKGIIFTAQVDAVTDILM
jgi:hypothetical protein